MSLYVWIGFGGVRHARGLVVTGGGHGGNGVRHVADFWRSGGVGLGRCRLESAEPEPCGIGVRNRTDSVVTIQTAA